MKSTLLTYVDRFRHNRREQFVLGFVLLILAVMVTVVVYWQLRYTGITMTNETYCGYEEHVHTEECYESRLICGLEETEGHTHSEECYEEQIVLVCTIEESEGHTHSEACYDEEGNLICGLEESTGHTHDESCYETQQVLVCELEECEPHTHTDECYESVLVCELEEHTHTVECLVDLNADVEDATIWEATLPELTGDLRTDVVAIAYSQLGYTESTANYTLAEDGTTHLGYTRYGTWYGSSYSDWDSIFTAFCLDYAGIADEFTYNAGAYAWSVDLANLGYYQTADVYTAAVGDVVFIDTDDDGKANVSAIVVAIDETAETITVIQGNYTVTDSEGNTNDIVAIINYSTAAETEDLNTEAEIVSLSAESETEESEEIEEITPVILGYANISPASEEIEEAEEVTEEIAEETSEDETEEEVDLEEDSETEEVEETEETEDETILSAVSATDYVTQVTELYTYAMTLTSDDSATAESIWNSLMDIWEQIYEEQEAGTLTLTDEELINVNTLTDEVLAYFTDTVGYDPYGISTAADEEEDNGSNELTTTSSDLSVAAGTVTATASSVTYKDGSFDFHLYVTFSNLPASTIKSVDDYTFYLYLPDGVDVLSKYTGQTYTGYDTNDPTIVAFKYTFEQDSSGNWYVKIVFDDSYVAQLTDEGKLIDGYVEFDATVSEEDIQDDTGDDVIIGTTDELQIIINGEDVTTTDPGENWLADITVTKSEVSYDSTTGTITYKIVVWSEKGTEGDITISDIVKSINNSSYSGTDITVDDINITSVAYYPYYGWDSYYGTSSWSDDPVYSNGYPFTSGSSASFDEYTYTEAIEYATDNSSGTLTITLPKLNGTTDSKYQGDCYVITYTVNADPESAEYNSSIQNTATATTETEGGTLIDTSSTTKTIVNHVVSKTGSYNSTTGEITWTITFNPGNADIANYEISDTYFANIIANSLTVTNTTSGTAAGEDTEYTINYTTDSEGNQVIESITFKGVDEVTTTDPVTGEDVTTYVNKNSYTITYKTTTDASLGDSHTYETNKVTVDDGDGTEVSEDSETVTVSGGGSISKSYTSADADYTTITDGSDTVYTRDVTWTTNIAVPVGGISSGTTIEDYIGTWNGDTSTYDSTSSTAQWFTYSQIVEFFKYYATNGITIGSNTVSYDDGNNGTNFSFKAYSTTNGWLTYDQLTADGASTTYAKDVFTQYVITFNTDVDYSGTLTLNYETTVDITSVITESSVTEKWYYNTVKVGSLKSGASYGEYDSLIKYDGNYHQGTTSTQIDKDGYLTWIVKAYIYPNSTDEYTLTDTLQEGLSFVSAAITIGDNLDSATMTIDSSTSGDFDATLSAGSVIKGTVTQDISDGSTSLAIVFDSSDYSKIQSAGGYITVTYKVKIEDFDPDNLANSGYAYDDTTGTYTISADGFTNTATLEWGNNSETETQTQTVTYTEETGGSTPGSSDHDTVSKSGTYNKGNSYIDYDVVINIDEAELNGGSPMTLTDEAKAYYYVPYGTVITLNYSSVKFYQLIDYGIIYSDTDKTYSYAASDGSTVTVSSSDIYTFSDGTDTIYYYKSAISIVWTYDSSGTVGSGWVIHTITATIPDKTAILMEYSYTVYAGSDGTYVPDFSVTNTATLSGNDGSEGEDGGETKDKYSEPSTSGGVSSGSGITIYKVDENNYGTTLSGAEFAFYKYDPANLNADANGWVQITGSDYTYYNSNTEETLSENPMNSDNHLETVNGTFTITNGVAVTETVGGAEKTNFYYFDWYSTETIYKIVEVEAASQYAISEAETVYFYWSDSDDSTTYTVPSEYQYNYWEFSAYDLNQSSLNEVVFVENTPQTSFTLTKTSTSNGSTISGAVFALYEWDNAKNDWVRIGTYETDKNGQIIIAYDETLYTFNKAYKLTEITTADGYNIGYYDKTEFYFWWSSTDDTTYPYYYPDGWGDDTITDNKYATVYDISHKSEDVTATNTKTTTSVSVTKAWVDANGNLITDESDLTNYYADVQLYYYLLDENGNVYNDGTSGGSSGSELITLSTTTGTASDTTVTLYSYTTATELSDSEWTSLNLSASNVMNAVYDDDYTDGYVEVYVKGGDTPTNMKLVIQNLSYSGITSVSPSKVETTYVGTDAYYTVRYSISSIKSALESAGYTYDRVGALSIDASSVGTPGEMQYLKVLGSAKTLDTGSKSFTYTSGSGVWINYFYNDYSNLVEDGAVLAIDYSNATAGTQMYLQFWLTSSAGPGTAFTMSSTSGTAYVKISDFVSDDFDWSTYTQINIQGITWNLDGTNTTDETTIDSVSILVPASSTTTSTTYTIVDTDSNTQSLNGGWTTYLSVADYGTYDGEGVFHGYDRTLYSVVSDALQEDGALIYITYSSTGETVTVGLQSFNNDATVKDGYASSKVTFANTDGGTASTYITVSDLSGISSFDWDYCNLVYFQNGSSATTIYSVSVLVPYDATTAISGVIPNASIYVELFNPDISGLKLYNATQVDTVTYKETYWNVLLSAENETAYGYGFDYEKVNEGTGEKSIGYAFFDAVYSNLESYVAVTVNNINVDSSVDAKTLLSNLNLIIQGDQSVNYGTMADISPSVVQNADGSYTLYYSCESIKDLLASSTGRYGSAADAFADYNAIVLALEGSYYQTSFTATVTDFDVVTRRFSTSSTYIESDLLGKSTYNGQPYYTVNDSGETVYYKETLDNINNWTVSYANLPISVTINGATYYYYYYFMETGFSGASTAYTTTYSQIEGENTGGEIVITNIETSYVLPSTGGIGDYTTLYEFGAMLILLALVGAGGYRNISRLRESLVSDPRRDTVSQSHSSGQHKRLPGMKNRKFVSPRIVRKGDSRAGPDG